MLDQLFSANIWNSIPQSIRIFPKHNFKDSLHQLLLRILELEDSYFFPFLFFLFLISSYWITFCSSVLYPPWLAELYVSRGSFLCIFLWFISEHERIATAKSSTAMINKLKERSSSCLIPRFISKLAEGLITWAGLARLTGLLRCAEMIFRPVLHQASPRGGGDSHMKQTGMLVVSLRGVDFGFWSRLGCSGQRANILCRQGLV